MGWNPCGMAVTYLRAGYKVDVRPFKDSDQTVTIRWFKCKPGAKWLPFSSVIRPQVWNSEDYAYQGRGEVWATAREFRQYPWVPGLEGTHYCGTRADFEEGGVVADPPVAFTPDGVMACCAAPPGGLLLGGELGLAGGAVVGGGSFSEVAFTTPSCIDPGGAHLGGDFGPGILALEDGYAGRTTAFAYLGDAGSGPFHLDYLFGPAGTVSVFTLVNPSFCVLGDLLYSGPSDVPFSLDLTPTPTRDVAIVIDTSPAAYTMAGMQLRPLP
jgi:hypothetical protein